jgi:hypothetical protein
MGGLEFIGRLARHGGGSTRRKALHAALGAATIAATSLGAGISETAAKTHKKRCQCRARGVGESCTANKQCCTNQTNRICAIQRNVGGPRCCGALQAECTGNTDCCESFECFNGVCVLTS